MAGEGHHCAILVLLFLQLENMIGESKRNRIENLLNNNYFKTNLKSAPYFILHGPYCHGQNQEIGVVAHPKVETTRHNHHNLE